MTADSPAAGIDHHAKRVESDDSGGGQNRFESSSKRPSSRTPCRSLRLRSTGLSAPCRAPQFLQATSNDIIRMELALVDCIERKALQEAQTDPRMGRCQGEALPTG